MCDPMCTQPDPDALEKAERKSDDGRTIFYSVPVKDSSEDCLTLNVWAPATARKAPVIVFLHGAPDPAHSPCTTAECVSDKLSSRIHDSDTDIFQELL
jgi:hypothetical protein